jgi:hypothetical protein
MDTFNSNQMPSMASLPEKKSHGALFAVVIILLLIVIGGLYFLGQRMKGEYYNESEAGSDDDISASLRQQSNSDDIDSIEADLNASSYDNLDQGAAAFEAELQS